jgi:hypothetical protein
MTVKDVSKVSAMEPVEEKMLKGGKEKYLAQKSREDEKKFAPDLSQCRAPTKRTR